MKPYVEAALVIFGILSTAVIAVSALIFVIEWVSDAPDRSAASLVSDESAKVIAFNCMDSIGSADRCIDLCEDIAPGYDDATRPETVCRRKVLEIYEDAA